MKSRIVILFLAFLCGWVIVLARAAQLQILPNPRLDQLKARQFSKVITLPARRGVIYDRNGKELAVSVAAYSLFADPSLIHHPRRLAKRLSRTIDRGYSYILRHLHRKSRFVWLRRYMNLKQKKQIEAWNIPGLGFIEESKRIYPNGHLLSQTLGFVGSSHHGLEGLEKEYDHLLRGPQKTVRVERDARGRPLLVDDGWLTRQTSGSDIQLTIDSALQFRLEMELRSAMKRADADLAEGVILDAKTSEILAIASVPDYDVNRPLFVSSQVRRNHAISDVFEPGSVLKTFAIAGALKDQLVRPNTRINCEDGHFEVGGHVITEAESSEDFKSLTVSEVLARSSNIGAAKIALKLGAKRLRNILLNFGFGEQLGVDFPGEARGIMDALPWRPHLLASVSFGQSIAVTPLQVAAAYAVIASDGQLRKPYFLKAVINPIDGKRKEVHPQVVRRVISPELAQTMRLMLSGVTTTQGTGYNARIPGFPVAGKTGTAQKVDPHRRGYMKGVYIASFAGFVPAQDPRFVIYVVLDHPRKGYYASTVAAPVFAKIARYAVRHAGLAPVVLHHDNIITENRIKKAVPAERSQKTMERASTKNQVPDLAGLTLRSALQALKGRHLKVHIFGKGVIQRTQPPRGHKLASGQNLNLYLRQ